MFCKIWCGLALVAGIAVSALAPPGAQAQVTYSWGAPGAHPWTAPDRQSVVNFDLLGAQGGSRAAQTPLMVAAGRK